MLANGRDVNRILYSLIAVNKGGIKYRTHKSIGNQKLNAIT